MFARTPRLLLRPGFPEDAPALAGAIADEAIARNLANVPWPYRVRDAEAYLASPRNPGLPSCLIFDLGGNKYRLVVHVSFAFGRLLVKFIGTHAEYDRIDPETVTWPRK